jgi:hypothetical protein
MKRYLGILGIAALAALASSNHSAHAGAKTIASVYIGSNYASGSLGSARNQGGQYPYGGQYIGCWTSFENGANQWGVCTAQDVNGYYHACTTTNAELIRAIRTVNGDSQIAFYSDGGGYCTRVYIYNYSYYEPKQP